jgi:hypothetical protein
MAASRGTQMRSALARLGICLLMMAGLLGYAEVRGSERLESATPSLTPTPEKGLAPPYEEIRRKVREIMSRQPTPPPGVNEVSVPQEFYDYEASVVGTRVEGWQGWIDNERPLQRPSESTFSIVVFMDTNTEPRRNFHRSEAFNVSAEEGRRIQEWQASHKSSPWHEVRLSGRLSRLWHDGSVVINPASVQIVAQGARLNCATFPETSKAVCDRFLSYWQRNGGLAQQGFPISEEMQELSANDGKTYTVQYFERAVFEWHPENAPSNDVLLQLLGVFRYKEMYSSSKPSGEKANTGPGAERFPQTGKTVGGKFLDYWRKNGGLPQFGYPISDEFAERSPLDGKDYTVQYFERAVFELHPENQPPYDVLLAQLGTFRWRARPVDPRTVTPQFRSELPDGEYIPLYPGAQITENILIDAIRSVEYEVAAESSNVQAFYDYIMPRLGWAFTYSITARDRHYNWTDPKEVVPWHLTLSVEIGGRLGSGRSLVSFFYIRYPDADKIPLYPEAEAVEVSTGPSGPPWPASCSDTVTTTTYLTSATPPELERFYEDMLPIHGWREQHNSGGLQSPGGMRLSGGYSVGSRREGTMLVKLIRIVDLTITAQARGDGRTRITHVVKTCYAESSGP